MARGAGWKPAPQNAADCEADFQPASPMNETIKAATAASENYGNFYGQNLSVVQAGVLLVYGVMKGLGYEVSLWRLVAWTAPIVLASVALAAVQFAWLDRRLKMGAQQ
jgi:uncharacterized membrane protein